MVFFPSIIRLLSASSLDAGRGKRTHDIALENQIEQHRDQHGQHRHGHDRGELRSRLRAAEQLHGQGEGVIVLAAQEQRG